MKTDENSIPEGLNDLNRVSYLNLMGTFSQTRSHKAQLCFRSAEGTENNFGEQSYTSEEFRRQFEAVMKQEPSGIIVEILPYNNGRAKTAPEFKKYKFTFPENGLGGLDKYGLPRQNPAAGGGADEVKHLEREHRYSTLFAAQAHEIEKRDLNARIRELEKEIREQDGKIAALARERERIEEEFRREISGTAHRAKVAAEGLGGMMTGVVSTLFPAFAATAKERIGGVVSGLTGIPDLDLLDEPGPEDDEPDENEPEPPAYSFSFTAHQALCQMGPQEFRQLENLIGAVAQNPDPGTRLWLLSALCESAAGLVKPAPRDPENNSPTANPNDYAA